MKTCAKSCPIPRLRANASAAAIVVWRGAVSWIMASCSCHSMRWRRSSALVRGRVAACGGEGGDIRIGGGERGLAQIEARRKTLHCASQDSLRIAGLDLAFHRDRKFVQRAVGGEHMGDVAEGILVLVEPAIGGHVDAPARHILAVMVARGQPQHLNDARSRRLVAIAREVRDVDAHAQTTTDEAEHTGRNGRGPLQSRVARPAPRALYIRYCSLIAAPRRLLSSMNWLMNSCIPCWKISSMRLFSSRARTARAWRWAGPWRP
jgi:hypothetical protein